MRVGVRVRVRVRVRRLSLSLSLTRTRTRARTRYEGEYRCEERRHRAALSPPPLGSRYPIGGRRHDLSTSLAELKPSIFDQYPVGTPSVHGRYAPSPAAAGTRLASLGGGELSTVHTLSRVS